MKLEKLNQWLLLASHVGILGGLILVGLQIRQDTEIAKVQLFSEITSSRIEMAGALLGENPAPIIAKSLTDPDALTLSEMYVVDSYLIRGLNEARRERVLNRVDLDIGIASPENGLAFYFGNEFAQKWWVEFTKSGEDMDNEVLREIDELIRSADPDFTMDVFKGLARSTRASPE